MKKTLSVSIEDIEKLEQLTISGTLHENTFNEMVVLSVGQTRIALNSQDLALALKEVVNFQQKQNPNIMVASGTNIGDQVHGV